MKFIWVWLILILGLASCGPIVKNPTPLTAPEAQFSFSNHEYRIQAGDNLDIKFFYYPELNESVIVRPDGRISLQLAHEVLVLNLTPAELTQLLTTTYAKKLTEPELTVIVRSLGGNKIFVDGEVGSAGVHDIVGPMTLRQAIAQAGGFKETARTNEVIVIRRRPNGDPLIITPDLKKVNEGTDLAQDIPIRPYDIVYVPRSPIANVNLWVKQYIRDLLPVMPPVPTYY